MQPNQLAKGDRLKSDNYLDKNSNAPIGTNVNKGISSGKDNG